MQNLLDDIAIAKGLTNWSRALGTHLEFHFSRGGVIYLHPLIKATDFNDVIAVFKLNESRIFFILGSKQNFLHFFLVTLAAFAWALFTTQANAWMPTLL